MLYVCVTTQNDVSRIGLVLWKVRQVLSANGPREFQLLVADDGSTDGTPALLEQYRHALPLTVIRHDRPVGYARTMEQLLQRALRQTDRPKRDCAVVLPPDFSVSPAVLPELLRRFESGADVVLAEGVRTSGQPLRGWVRRNATRLLHPGVSIPGVHDLTSGVAAFRLVTLKRALTDERTLESEHECAFAELVARAAERARQIATTPIPAADLYAHPQRGRSAIRLAVDLYRTGRRLRVPPPDVEAFVA